MQNMEATKAFASVLVVGIVFLGGGILAARLVHPHRLETTAYKVEGVSEAASGAPEAPPQPDPPISALLASASPEKGEAYTKKVCVACHSFNEGGRAGVGPNLYGIVGLKHGHMEGYSYSSALTAKAGPWTFDGLNAWLKSPRAYAPGTKMSFAGIENPRQRADVIAYLNSDSHNPEALPKPPAADAAAPKPATPPPSGTPAAGGAAQTRSGQASQPSENQNMPGSAAAQQDQNPLAKTNTPTDANTGKVDGQPQPTPGIKTP